MTCRVPHPFQHIRIILEVFLRCIVVATTVFMITLADITGKANAALFINIPDKHRLLPQFGQVVLLRKVFLQMESVFTHGLLILVWLHSALLHFEKYCTVS